MNSQPSQWFSDRDLGFIALIALMAATRFHHEGSAIQLPDASLAVSFLGGLYYSGVKRFLVLLLLAGLVDYFAITALAVNDYCISPAYLFLVPTYWVVWAGGQWLPKSIDLSRFHLAVRFLMVLSFSGISAFLISNWSFYWFSGKLNEMDAWEYASWLVPSLLPYLLPLLAYCLIGMFVATVFKLLKDARVFVATR